MKEKLHYILLLITVLLVVFPWPICRVSMLALSYLASNFP